MLKVIEQKRNKVWGEMMERSSLVNAVHVKYIDRKYCGFRRRFRESDLISSNFADILIEISRRLSTHTFHEIDW